MSWHQTRCLPGHVLRAPRARGRRGHASLTAVCRPQMQQVYDMIMQHKRAMQDMQLLWEKALQQHQHGYDSDEEVDSELGTWEHQLRRMEMDKTRGGPRGGPGLRPCGRRGSDARSPARRAGLRAGELASCACFSNDKCVVLWVFPGT